MNNFESRTWYTVEVYRQNRNGDNCIYKTENVAHQYKTDSKFKDFYSGLLDLFGLIYSVQT